MRWPPNKTWTSKSELEGYWHFEVKQYGGKGKERWVELFPINNKKILIRITWLELKHDAKWTSGWQQLPTVEDGSGKIN